MFRHSRRPRLIGGAVAAVAVLGLGGVAVAAHSSPSISTTAAVASPSASAIPTLGGAAGATTHKAKKVPKPKELTGKVTSVSATAITVVDSQGMSHAYTVTSSTVATSAANQPAVITGLPVGEIVVVKYTGGGKHGAAAASPGATPATSTSTGATSTAAMAASVHDTGFRSA